MMNGVGVDTGEDAEARITALWPGEPGWAGPGNARRGSVAGRHGLAGLDAETQPASRPGA